MISQCMHNWLLGVLCNYSSIVKSQSFILSTLTAQKSKRIVGCSFTAFHRWCNVMNYYLNDDRGLSRKNAHLMNLFFMHANLVATWPCRLSPYSVSAYSSACMRYSYQRWISNTYHDDNSFNQCTPSHSLGVQPDWYRCITSEGWRPG